MFRLIAAVLTGYAAIGVLVVSTDHFLATAIPGFGSMKTPPAYYFAVSLLTDSLYSMIGGYICAVIARTRPLLPTLALVVAGEIVGATSQLMLWNTVPHWFGSALLVLYPPSVWLGSKLRTAVLAPIE